MANVSANLRPATLDDALACLDRPGAVVVGRGVGDALDIAPRLGERGGVEDVAPEDLPRIASCGTEECVAQAQRAIG